MKIIRILHIFSSLNVGGAECRVIDFVRAFDREKYHFDFLTMKTEAQYFDKEILQLGCNEYKIPQPRETGIIKNIILMYRIMKAGNYDAIHAHTSFHSGLACFAAWLAGIPIRISHSRTSNSEKYRFFTKLYTKIGKFFINLFPNFLSCS